ncbi:RnfABCDGE type electron transport complex subunit B [Mahella australiensis]|uniref:Ion-translocating oxidoreductase complex subunit B n=1 Tax=Mahella australiensis (strain DSM 15567 / CIP 107919 / 50-1 BON) TaxID=697281 RepID=F3ZVJ3_MAHA5|nr:Fe-S cluster domain-containing protein [Mahella australiensis]AEE96355.1 electron transport complex, RnfABCDGE type, B subunit [Mahella australiensis 50-1 BON]
MNINDILIPVVTLGGLGLIFGAILAFASSRFAVEKDPRVDEVREALPGANCGACGYPGCDGLAAAIVAGKAPVNACTVGGAASAEKIGAIMGVEAQAGEKQVARVLCQGDLEAAAQKYKYVGIESCAAANALGGGSKACGYGCLGFGDCVKACPFDAIDIVNGVAIVDEKRCTGCTICVAACPKGIIQMVPQSKRVVILCASLDKGKLVRGYCKVGCIACNICVRKCPENAIVLENNLAHIVYDKCTNCAECVDKCPASTIKNYDGVCEERETAAL